MTDFRDVVLRCVDSLARRVLVDGDVWRKKCERHPELVNNLASVEATLSKPDMITADKDFPERECFYRKGAIDGSRRAFLKVVLELNDDESECTFVTAHLVDRLPTSDEEARLL